MIKIEFLGPINRDEIEIQADSLREVSTFLKDDKDISKWLESCAIAVNDEIVFDLDKKLSDGDKVSLLPPVCGG